MHPPRIEIAGLTASGKTTLAKLLGQAGMVSVLEDFRANPFWKAFNVDHQAHAFETETTFLLQHYHDIKVASRSTQPFVCDFSLLLDLAYANVTLSKTARDIFSLLFDHLRTELGPPTLLIELRCAPAVAMERIRLRGRVDEQTITLEYLGSVASRLEELLCGTQSYQDHLVIDTDRENFVKDSDTLRRILEDVRGRLAAADGSG